MNNKEEKVRCSLLLSPSLRDKIDVEAQKQHRSFTAQCEYFLEFAIANLLNKKKTKEPEIIRSLNEQ